MSIRHTLLALLSEGPKYGLQLRQEFEARTGEVWPLNVGQVYTTLQRLERDGLVESEDGGGRPQNAFTITPAGADELRTWLLTPPDVVPPPRDELVMKVLVAMRVPGVDMPQLLQSHRRHLVQAMQEYTRLKADLTDAEVELSLVADSELFRIEAIIRWLDIADARLARLPATTDRPADAPRAGRRIAGIRR
ncbi:helix-turn-helix transcriptional regulator [Actinoplanes sichuanensis]|uniref:PadR family transcriptional regulator n=1 Tax=Actinoplanes sichuanensis TaxID=512349 RepID=A0ABW4A1T2_9ACTN|nr:PadR family transcriptional regulator [Actinoplanes sichuanensis]BEL04128.1 helix-turn-helix transcriptional regulator [Actinoplanes sichuanensis]